jgi:hypothetical protein
MREFLSNYQKTNANKLPDKAIWDKTISLVATKIGNDAFKIKRSVNKSVCDSVLVSIAQILSDGNEPIDLAVNHKRLLADEDYIKYVSSGTSSETSVNGRITLARNYFLGL